MENINFNVGKTYSETEVQTDDVWLNDKPIYRKTLVKLGSEISGNSIFYDGYFPDMDVIVDAKLFIDWTTDNGSKIFGANYELLPRIALDYISVLQRDGSTFDLSLLDSLTLTLEYTKTT